MENVQSAAAIKSNGHIMAEPSKRYLTRKEASAYLGLSRGAVYKLIAKRDIPFIPIATKTYRFDKEELDKWMKGRTVRTVREI